MLYYFFSPVLFFFRYACSPDLNVHWGNNTYDICNICFCASRTFVFICIIIFLFFFP